MLTPTQLQQLGVTAQGVGTTPAVGPECTWSDEFEATGAHLSGLFVTGGGGGGLGALYDAHQSGGYKFFLPTNVIKGYPAVFADDVDERGSGICFIVIGVSDQVALDVGAQMRGGTNPAPNYHNPCGVVTQVAVEMVNTITAGG